MAEVAGVDVELYMRSLLGGFFRGDTVRQMMQVSREVFFSASDRLYRQGAPPQFVYFLVDGEVHLETEDAEPWSFDGGDIVGVLDADSAAAHRRTAIARTDVHALALAVRDWHDIQEDNLEMVRLRLLGNARNLLGRGLSLTPTLGLPQVVSVGAPPSLVTQMDLDSELNAFERLLSLRLAPAFALAGTQSLLELAQEAREVRRGPGEILFEEGEEATHAFVNVTGVVSLEREATQVTAQFGPTTLVGGYLGLGQVTYPVRARAESEVVAMEIEVSHLFEVMEDHYDLVRAVMAFMANERMRVQDAAPPVANPKRHPVATVPKATSGSEDLPR